MELQTDNDNSQHFGLRLVYMSQEKIFFLHIIPNFQFFLLWQEIKQQYFCHFEAWGFLDLGFSGKKGKAIKFLNCFKDFRKHVDFIVCTFLEKNLKKNENIRVEEAARSRCTQQP